MQAHIQFYGSGGFYTVSGRTKIAQRWIAENLSFESWQGNQKYGIAIDGGQYCRDIAAGAIRSGLRVSLNDKILTLKAVAA